MEKILKEILKSLKSIDDRLKKIEKWLRKSDEKEAEETEENE